MIQIMYVLLNATCQEGVCKQVLPSPFVLCSRAKATVTDGHNSPECGTVISNNAPSRFRALYKTQTILPLPQTAEKQTGVIDKTSPVLCVT